MTKRNKSRYLRVGQEGALKLLGPVDRAASRAFASAQAWQCAGVESRRDAAVESWQLLRTVYNALERAAGLCAELCDRCHSEDAILSRRGRKLCPNCYELPNGW